MTQSSYGQLADVPALPATTDQEGPRAEVHLSRWQGFLLSLGSLVLVFGVGIGVTIAGGVVIHAHDPARPVNTFAAFHNAWVVGVLLGIAVLWLLPPYPWAKRVIAPMSAKHPASTSGGADGGGSAPAATDLEKAGPGARPPVS